METWPDHDQDTALSWSIPCTTPATAEYEPASTAEAGTRPTYEASVPDGAIPEQDGTVNNDRVRVLVLGDRVGVVLPPGDTLVLTRDEAHYLAITLDRAIECTTT